MNKKWLVLLALLTLLVAAPVGAQEGDANGFTENFDDATLPGWEHSGDAIVTNGVLKMDSGNMAVRFGDFADITMSVKVRYSGSEGVVVVNYYFREDGKYGLLLQNGSVILEKAQSGVLTNLAEASVTAVQPDQWIDFKVVVSGGQHQVYVNDELQITATDSTPLSASNLSL
jgi:hypothetical protein